MRTRFTAAAFVLLAATLSAVAPARASVVVVATLAPGEGAVWAESAPTSDVPGAFACATCKDYAIDLTATAARLRVAIDSSKAVTLYLLKADGSYQAHVQGEMSAELYVDNPAAGRWWVRAYNTTNIRLRAKLESVVPAPPTDSTALLPNLRITPPYEFTATGGCNDYETIEYGAKKCLRFSLGPENIGPGPFLLRVPVAEGLALPGPVYQRILHGDGTITERRAGDGQFHKTHAHYHHNGFGSLEILKVTDRRRGAMRPAGVGPKQGFCMIDFRIADWPAFANAPTGGIPQDCAGVPLNTDVYMGLSAGWGDIYWYRLDGNYVEMGDNADGYYVVRSMADTANVVLETNERDNSGYAYIQIAGDTVTVLERGYGTSPWDRRKHLVDDLLPDNAPPGPVS